MPNNSQLNWNPLNDNMAEANRKMISQAFMPLTHAAEVPAVRLSHAQWAMICDMIVTLSDLNTSCPNGLDGALVQGSFLAGVAEKATSILHLATYGELSVDPEPS